MFAESMLETSWAHRSRRSWMTLTSFGLQAVVIGLLLMIPLLRTAGLPPVIHVSTPVSLGRPDPGPARRLEASHGHSVQIIPFTGRIMAPSRVPNGIPKGGQNELQSASGGDRIGDDFFPIGSPDGIRLPITGTRPVIPPPPPPTTKRTFRTSTILEGSLIRRVQPVYPPLARMARIQGSVVVAAIISKAGTMEHVQAISGHPMLIPAAVDAVSQWRYRPYVLNGEAIEVETQITVNFVLGSN
ncbi:MAG TPA: energy transducer TonB [Candidatus Sulfotelmatobacter sp.]|nr:energy transducer TonB [Candidatus Sulfotelmatobacter sp.]